MCIGYYGNAIASLCWHKNNNNSNTDDVLWHDNMLPSHWLSSCIMDLFYEAASETKEAGMCDFILCRHLRWFQPLKEESIIAVHCIFPLDLQFAATHACFCKTYIMNAFTFYVRMWECEKALVRLKLNRFPNHIWMKLERICINQI